MFTSIMNAAEGMTIQNVVVLTLCSVVFGLLLAVTYMSKGKYTKSFAITLVILPAVVQIVIMMVNGSIGTGVAIAGAFSLVRFRSQPANAKEISTIFLAMAIGLTNAMGYLTFALFVTIVFCLLLFILDHSKFGEGRQDAREIRITIPESLDYTDVFDDLFAEYLKNVSLERVKTTNMGSMFELTYLAEFIKGVNQKEFIDAVRCRNGNLTVYVSRPMENREEI
ncbi:MAG: DUF4956 domain-containing protein [Lachnospiraceae bacterium]|nr:DUF4956 domain-containing protein [Lachnospiraceae bacterium]